MAAAALYDDTRKDWCSKRRAILEAHGENDTTIPYAGGHTNSGGDVPNVAEWVGWWAERIGVEDGAEETQHQGYERVAYKGDDGKVVVEHYKVSDLGHCWPSSTGGGNSDGSRGYCGDHSWILRRWCWSSLGSGIWIMRRRMSKLVALGVVKWATLNMAW
ncbi:hypothetical protein BU23DRAFT_627275 [Bimuria novae-zelandiae CBS 107.79]|uniref:Uncharacterized protein n=1 Tax=Bimuria novae-zelandiae CBS 107.79 TaxID=1447943 RepID=A0A6A5UL78_9PLEO|nr:hypothetical protein BU23DRAFT_627275 [Bimuria novae-zelandiae CBS 107.79]